MSNAEKSPTSKTDETLSLATATYGEFIKAQQKLREKTRPTIPYIDMGSRQGYTAAMEVVKVVREYGLEGNPNIALGGVTVFVGSEEDFNNLQKLITEHPEFSIRLPK